MTPEEYLKLPYSRCFRPIYKDGQCEGYSAYIREFPGCLAEKDTLSATWYALYIAAISWIAAALDLGQEIPEPLEKVWEKGKP